MNRREFANLCEEASGMLISLAERAGNPSFETAPIVFDKSETPEIIAVQAKVILAIAELSR